MDDNPVSPFPPTRWTVILTAQGKGEEAETALNDLCGIY
jgi:hypothetical protein